METIVLVLLAIGAAVWLGKIAYDQFSGKACENCPKRQVCYGVCTKKR